MSTTTEAIKVLQAFESGRDIEVRCGYSGVAIFNKCTCADPSWDFYRKKYKVVSDDTP